MTDTTLVTEAPPRPRGRLTASPAMFNAAQRLGLVEVEAPVVQPPAEPPPSAARIRNGGTAKTDKPELPELPEGEVLPKPPKPNKAEVDPEKAARLAAVRQVEALLCECFPEAFRTPPPPLAIGIHLQILDIAGDNIDAKALGWFLQYWTRKPGYLDAIAHGEPRRNLDGSVAGEPDEQQRRAAAAAVYGRRAEAVLARIAARRAAEMEATP
jgi:hypothetical protein